MCFLHHISGAFTHQPEELKAKIGTKARDLIKRSFDDIDPALLVDYHTHVAGIGKGTEAFVNPKMFAWRHPLHRLKLKIYLSNNQDLDDPQRRRLPNFDLFLRLLDEKRYEGLLFADISAMTQYNRRGKPLTTILQREDLHERLVNGSDYPLPAINVLIRTGTLVRQGYITTEQRACLNEIYDYNPLLFDFALKRAIKIPGTAKRLPASIFMNNSSLDVGISRSR